MKKIYLASENIKPFSEKRLVYVVQNQAQREAAVERTEIAKKEIKETHNARIEQLRIDLKEQKVDAKQFVEEVHDIARDIRQAHTGKFRKDFEALYHTLQALSDKLGIDLKKAFWHPQRFDNTPFKYYNWDITSANKRFDEKMYDFKSEDEKYGGSKSDSRVNWLSPDDIKNAPEAYVREAGDKVKTEIKKLKKLESEEFHLRRRGTAMEKLEVKQKIENQKQVITSARKDLEAAIVRSKEEAYGAAENKFKRQYENVFEKYQKDEIYSQRVKELGAEFNLPDNFGPETKLARPSVELRVEKGEKASDKLLQYFGNVPREGFSDWNALYTAMHDNTKNVYKNATPEMQKQTLTEVNKMIDQSEVASFLTERQRIYDEVYRISVKKPAQKETGTEKPVAPESESDIPGPEAPKPPSFLNPDGTLKSVLGESGKKEEGTQVPYATPEQTKEQEAKEEAAAKEAAAKEKARAAKEASRQKRIEGYNKEGLAAIKALDKSDLVEFGIDEKDIKEPKPSKNGKGLLVVEQMQKYLRANGFKRIDGKPLVIDGYYGRNSEFALKGYKEQKENTAALSKKTEGGKLFKAPKARFDAEKLKDNYVFNKDSVDLNDNLEEIIQGETAEKAEENARENAKKHVRDLILQDLKDPPDRVVNLVDKFLDGLKESDYTMLRKGMPVPKTKPRKYSAIAHLNLGQDKFNELKEMLRKSEVDFSNLEKGQVLNFDDSLNSKSDKIDNKSYEKSEVNVEGLEGKGIDIQLPGRCDRKEQIGELRSKLRREIKKKAVDTIYNSLANDDQSPNTHKLIEKFVDKKGVDFSNLKFDGPRGLSTSVSLKLDPQDMSDLKKIIEAELNKDSDQAEKDKE